MTNELIERPSTKKHLLLVAIRLLDTKSTEEITSDQILLESGVSKGSLYHHYKDFSDLMEDAEIQRFASYVSGTLEDLITYVENAPDSTLVKEKFHELARAHQFTDSLEFRMKRLRITYSAAINERMKSKLMPVQEDLTQKWMKCHEICIERQWAKTDLNSRAVSLILQSTIIGRILDDNSSIHIDTVEWVHALEFIFDTFFFNNLDDSRKVARINENDSKIIVLTADNPKCKELENSGYEVISDVRNSTLQLSHMSDVEILNESYLKALYKMYQIVIIGSEYAQKIVDLHVASSDYPNYSKESGQDFPDLSGLSDLWDADTTLYGAFFHSEMVGYLRVQNLASGVEIRTCNIDRKHRAHGLASALVSYAILSKQNKGVRNFISKNDALIPARFEVITRLGFKPSPSTLTYAKKSLG